MLRQQHPSEDSLTALEVEHIEWALDDALRVREAATLSFTSVVVPAEGAALPTTADGGYSREEGFVDEGVVVLQFVPDGEFPWFRLAA